MPALRTDSSTPSQVDISPYLTALSGGGAAVAAQSSPMITVRMPKTPGQPGSTTAAEHRMDMGEGTQHMSVDAATAAFWGWSDAQQKALAKKAWYLGLIASPDDIEGAFQAWKYAVGRAGDYAQAGRQMDPSDAMDLLAAGSPAAQQQRDVNGRAGQTVTQKQRQINLTDPVQARSLIEQAFQQSMGRDPTDAEYRTLLASLHSQQQANPTVTQTTQKYDNQGNPLPDSTSTTSGGIDPSAFVQQAAQNDPEAAQYQAGTFYFNTLMKALSSPV